MSKLETIKKRSSTFFQSAILQSTAIVFVARIGGAGIGLLIQILLARSLGGDQLGLVYIALAIANIGSVVAALGYPSVSVRFLRRYHIKNAPNNAALFRKQTIKDVILLSIALMVSSALIISFLPMESNERNVLFLCLLLIPVFALLGLNGGTANAYQRIDISYLPDVFFRPLFWCLQLIICIGLGGALEAKDAIIMALIATLLALLIQWAWLHSSLKATFIAQNKKEITGKPKLFKLWRSAALPMIAMTLLTNMIFDIDVLILSLFLTNEDLALFGVAFKIAFLIGFGVHVIQQAALPKITDAFTIKNSTLMRQEILNAVIPSTIGSLLSIIFVAILGQWVLTWFGPNFSAAFSVLFLLSLCTFIRALAGPASQMLVLAGKQKQILIIYGSGLIILALLNLIFVPMFSINGAALALVGATIYWSMSLSFAALKATNVRVDGLGREALKLKTYQNLSFIKNGTRF